MKDNIQVMDNLFPDSPEIYKLKKTFLNVLKYIDSENWMGACHASTAIMYMLLKEQEYDVNACIGEVEKNPILFDHSWIEYKGKVIDAAISNTLIQGLNFPPVFLSHNLKSSKETEFEYGINHGNGIDQQAMAISNMTIGTYMDAFPGHPMGLWGIAKEIAKKQSLKFNVEKAKKKWGESAWLIKS